MMDSPNKQKSFLLAVFLLLFLLLSEHVLLEHLP